MIVYKKYQKAKRIVDKCDKRIDDRQRSQEMTTRECVICYLIFCGMTNAEISAYLRIDCGHLKNLLTIIYRNAGVRNRYGLAGWWWARL